MLISVVIASVRAATIGEAVRSVVGQSHRDFELLVVEQGDPAVAEAVDRVAGGDSRVRVVSHSVRALSSARNAGFRAATGDLIAVMDDDSEADPDWLAVIVDRFERHSVVGLVGGALVAPPAARRGVSVCPASVPSEASYLPGPGRPPPTGWDWVGGNFAVRTSTVRMAGDLDECLGAGAPFPAGEDTDFKLRLEALGIGMLSTPAARVTHTYGRRYGMAAVARHSRNYATGNGGLAGKLSLLGDPRGPEWLAITRRQCTRGVRSLARSPRLAQDLLRWHHYSRAYRKALRGYTVDERGLMRPVQGVL